MLLHGYFRSSAAFRVRAALNLKGLAYDDAFHHLRHDGHKAPDYLKLNPQGLVPALETDDGAVLTQSVAIIEYLEEMHPQPALLPAAPADRARVRALALICAADIHPINNLRILRYLRHEFGLDEERVQAWYRHWIEEGFAAIEPQLAGDPRTGRFVHGDTPGLADLCLVPQALNGMNFKVDMTPFPTIMGVYEACMALPAFQKAAPSAQPDAE